MSSMPDLRRFFASRRVRGVLWGLLAVGVLAAVILGVGALTSPKRPDASLPELTSEQPGSIQYGEGMAALTSGDTTRAVSLLQKAATAGNEPAKAKLKEIGKRAAPVSLPPTTPPANGKKDLDAGYTGELEPATLLPYGVTGFAAGTVGADGESAILPLDPSVGSQYYGVVSKAVLTVLDASTVAKAQAYIDGLGKAYPQKVGPVTVGIVPGRTGADDEHSASVVFRRGRYVFEVVATGPGEATAIQSLAARIAEAFPASK